MPEFLASGEFSHSMMVWMSSLAAFTECSREAERVKSSARKKLPEDGPKGLDKPARLSPFLFQVNGLAMIVKQVDQAVNTYS